MVVKDAPNILTHPKNAKMREGMTAHFSCLADGNPVPRYVWTKGDSNEVKYIQIVQEYLKNVSGDKLFS